MEGAGELAVAAHLHHHALVETQLHKIQRLLHRLPVHVAFKGARREKESVCVSLAVSWMQRRLLRHNRGWMESLRPSIEERLAALGIGPLPPSQPRTGSGDFRDQQYPHHQQYQQQQQQQAYYETRTNTHAAPSRDRDEEHRRRAEELRLEAKETELRERLLECRLQEEKVRAQQEAGLLLQHREEEISRLKRTHAAAILALRKDYESEIAGLKASIAQLQDDLVRASSERESRLAEIRSLADLTHTQIREDVHRKLQMARAMFEEERVELIQRHNRALEDQVAACAKKLDLQERDHKQQHG